MAEPECSQVTDTPGTPPRMEAGVMTQFTHDTAPTQYVEGGGIRTPDIGIKIMQGWA
jgi:hypothetical protein